MSETKFVSILYKKDITSVPTLSLLNKDIFSFKGSHTYSHRREAIIILVIFAVSIIQLVISMHSATDEDNGSSKSQPKQNVTSVPTLSILRYQYRADHLKYHNYLYSHTGEQKAYPCKECGQCFASPALFRYYYVYSKHSATRAAASVQDI